MTAPTLAEADPKGLIRESYRIEDIDAAQCRAIFLDWALSLSPGTDPQTALRVLLAANGQPDHPMTALLTEGLSRPTAPPRRRGRMGRPRPGEPADG